MCRLTVDWPDDRATPNEVFNDLDTTDSKRREQMRAELARVEQSQITEDAIREIVANSLDSTADSQEVRQIANEIESGILDTETDDSEFTSTAEAEQGNKRQEDGSRTQGRETDDREPEFEN